MKEVTKEQFNKVKTLCEKYKVCWDLIDTRALWDSHITDAENLNLISEHIKVLANAETKINLMATAKEIKNENEKEDFNELKQIKEAEQEAEKHFNNELTELKEASFINFEKYKIPAEYIKSVVRGFNNAFIFLGAQGLGKTYLTRQVLSKDGARFIESRGVASPMALYQFLYTNNHKDLIIVFDDLAGLINNPSAVSVLLGALWDKKVCWNSTSDKLKIPKEFIFNGKIILIANKLNGADAEIIKSRCLCYLLEMSREEKLKVMQMIAKTEHEKLTQEERFKIVEFLKDNSIGAVEFDLRTQQKAEQLYLYDKEKWKELTEPLLKKNSDIILLKQLLNECLVLSEAEKRFIAETGKSRRTFYNLKKEVCTDLFSASCTGMHTPQIKRG